MTFAAIYAVLTVACAATAYIAIRTATPPVPGVSVRGLTILFSIIGAVLFGLASIVSLLIGV